MKGNIKYNNIEALHNAEIIIIMQTFIVNLFIAYASNALVMFRFKMLVSYR